MSAYPYAGSGPAYLPATSADPTAVMSRRISAWVVDALIFVALMAFFGPTPLSPFADYYTEDELPSDDCGYVMKLDDVANCFDIGDRFYVTDTTETVVQAAVGIAWFLLILVALQGLKGVTPGKAIFRVKVVDEAGGPPGPGRALLRTLLWIVDGAPWCLPLVGFITGLSTKGHRRVGDMAAKTFVVDRSHAGPVVVPGMVTAAAYGPGQPWGGQPWGGPQPGTAATPPARWGPPPAATTAPPGGEPTPAPEATTGPAGDRDWTPAPTPSPGAGEGREPQAAPTAYTTPQWDAARGTYIVWEPTRGAWLGWDQVAQEWRPL